MGLRSTPRRARAGYALLWILVFTAIVAAVAAATLPYVVPVNDQARVDSTITELRAVGAGIAAFAAAVHGSSSADAINLPGRLSQLTTVVRPGIDRNSCWTGGGGVMTAHDSTDWVATGPFVAFMMPTIGLWTPIGRLRDSIPRRSANGPLYVEMPGVAHADMVLIKATIDHGVGDTVSMIYRPPVGGAPDTGTLRFQLLNASLATAFNKC